MNIANYVINIIIINYQLAQLGLDKLLLKSFDGA